MIHSSPNRSGLGWQLALTKQTAKALNRVPGILSWLMYEKTALKRLTQRASSLQVEDVMKIIRAQSAGFCWGVERAIDLARKYAEEGHRPVYTDGPLIHNRQMMETLTREGISDVGDYQSQSDIQLDDSEKDNSVVVVRAHGISPERRKYLKSLGLPFKDATCPDVAVIAGKIRSHARKGFHTVIFGDPQHPEVIGLLGYTMDRGHVIRHAEDIDALPDLGEQVCMVSQSTMFTDEFHRLAAHLRQRFPSALTFDTICGATKERQDDVVKLVQQGAEAIVVIGGHHSANTRKLTSLVEKQGVPAFHVETAEDLNVEALLRYEKIGVTAGASTPEFMINAVCQSLEQAASQATEA